MAIDTAEKRRAVSGVPFAPLGPGVTPNAAKDAQWRAQAANCYIEPGAGVDAIAPGEIFSIELSALFGRARGARQTLTVPGRIGSYPPYRLPIGYHRDAAAPGCLIGYGVSFLPGLAIGNAKTANDPLSIESLFNGASARGSAKTSDALIRNRMVLRPGRASGEKNVEWIDHDNNFLMVA